MGEYHFVSNAKELHFASMSLLRPLNIEFEVLNFLSFREEKGSNHITFLWLPTPIGVMLLYDKRSH
jgi:hypothetical protein